MLVRDGAAVPHARLAQSTDWIYWRGIELRVFGAETSTSQGLFCRPEDGELRALHLSRAGGKFTLDQAPLGDAVSWSVSICPQAR